MNKCVLFVVLSLSLALAQEPTKADTSVSVQPKNKVLSKALKLLDVQLPSAEVPQLSTYTVTYVDPSTGELTKVSVVPPPVVQDEGRTATAMLGK